jgi:hypothetical protein
MPKTARGWQGGIHFGFWIYDLRATRGFWAERRKFASEFVHLSKDPAYGLRLTDYGRHAPRSQFLRVFLIYLLPARR